MLNIPEIDANAGIIVFTVMTLWYISARTLKTLVRFHKTDDPAYCGCGSHAPNLGSKSHYTVEEFKRRLDKKYRRSNAKIVEDAAKRAYQRYIRTRDPSDFEKSRKLNNRWHAIMDKHALKCDRKWFACTKCGQITRRHYVPEDHQRIFGLTSEDRIEFDGKLSGTLLARAYNQKTPLEAEIDE